MINKKNLWFLTLFSLILVLSVYFVTMPTELLLTNNSNFVTKDTSEEDTKVSIEENEVITALKVADDEEYLKELDTLKLVLMDNKSSVEEKNDAFDKMKDLNTNKNKEEELENLIESSYKLKSFIKIKNNQVKVVISGSEHDTTLANNIMNTIQEKFETKMYVTVQFSA